MSGKILVTVIVMSALFAGAVLYWMQEYAFYGPVEAGSPMADIRLTSVATGEAEVIPVAGFEGIDATSSPIRFRGCFTIPTALATLTETYVVHERPTPLIGPRSFPCFDAETIGTDLEEGAAVAFLSEAEIHPGVDRVIAVYPDGRAFAWHQLNESADE